MRQIKFRGRRLDNGAFAHGYLMPSNGAVLIFDFVHAKVSIRESSPKAHGDITLDSEINIESRGRCLFVVDPATVGQFTGSIDKNGKEIYEGDIVKLIWTDSLHKQILELPDEQILTVEFDCGMFQFNDQVPLHVHTPPIFNGMPACEVIGNIYENPELLTR